MPRHQHRYKEKEKRFLLARQWDGYRSRIDLVDDIVDPVPCQPRNIDDFGFERRAVELVADRAEPFLARHRRLDLRTDEKTGGWGPQVTALVILEIICLVQMAAGYEADRVAPYQFDETSARPRFDRPVARIAFIGAVEEQRLVQEPGEASALGIRHRGLEPGRLRRLLGATAAEQHRIEPDQAEALDIL